MKVLLVLLFSATAIAQQSAWVRTQFTDKLTGNTVTAFQLFPRADGSERRSYVGLTCDKAGRRYTAGYFTDEMVSLNVPAVSLRSMYYPTTIQYRADASKVKTDSVTVRADFQTININKAIIVALIEGTEVAISFPSQRGYMVTDVFASSPLPAEYSTDCSPPKK